MNLNGDVDLLARTVEGMTTWCQMFIKVIPLYIQRDRFIDLYEAHLNFWNPDDFPKSLQRKIESTYKLVYRILFTFAVLVYCTCVLFYLQPIFKPNELLVACYVPDIPYAFEILQVYEYIYGFTFAAFVVGIDSLYVIYCTHLIVQIKIINYSLEHIDVTDANFMNDFKVLIEYHNFLLMYASELLSFWSLPLLAQYVISIYMSCMELYMLVENLSNFGRVMLSAVYCSSLYVQFALYCFPATYFIAEAEILPVSMYNSNWYEGTISIQKNVCFVIMRAQKSFRFYAAGLAEINCQAFVAVLKTSLTIFTIMRQFKEELTTDTKELHLRT
ncbi:odorant receptor 49b-like isoform X2 [Atheta coriaria]|uniref:odorant receptor 49b-like isoform X2 n=1 Tax=Dalotia coriaria TaxID=877792 RepID=UPI0031F354AB